MLQRAASAATSVSSSPPGDDDAERSDLSDSDSDSSAADEPAAKPAAPAKRKRASRATPAASASAAPTAIQPLTTGDAVGRHALAPAHVWLRETCHERKGAGWEVSIIDVDTTIGAVHVTFVHARTKRGKKFASEWLIFSALNPIRI